MAALTLPPEEALRLAVFLTLFLVLAGCERTWPRRALTVPGPQRWRVNLAVIGLDTLAARLLLPLGPFALAILLQDRGWGLLGWAHCTGALEIAVSLLLLDLLIYGQHRLFHQRPLLWRLHRMHHTDLDLDVSSALRFHPLEILLSLLIKMGAVAVLGVSPQAILLFEILLNATSMFSHANLRLNLTVDAWLRWLVVTPDMHRVHHSVIIRETNSNFGFNLPWWDRLFGTYNAQPRQGHDGMVLGLSPWRHQEELTLWSLLRLPFLPTPGRRPTP